MYTDKLPALITSGEKKGQVAQVKVTNEKLGHPKENPILIPQAQFEFPQFGRNPVTGYDEEKKADIVTPLTDDEARVGIEEFIKDAGSAAAALEVLNDATRNAATNAGKGFIRLAESGDVNEVVATGLKKSREFTWKEVERQSAKEIGQALQTMAANISSMTAEEIAAHVKKLLQVA